jgi:NAD(P)-dependent dehydrogenase (short-subunit alcohol dehydrogenase family)
VSRQSLAGKLALITGGARGIGRATAVDLVAAGAQVVIADLDGSLATRTAEEVGASARRLDVTDHAAFTALLDEVERDVGPLDILINNAGVMPIGPFADSTDDAVERLFAINVFAVMHGTREALRRMMPRRRGHIVNIASMAGMVAVPGQVVYAGTKFAVVGLSSAMADEFAPHGVNVTAVLPAFTNTELISGTATNAATKPVQPEVVAAAIVKVLDKPKVQASVPSWSRWVGIVTMMLSARSRRWLGKKTGTDTVFLNVDTTARAAYEDRAQHATGVVEHRD